MSEESAGSALAHDDRGPGLLAVTWSLAALSGIFLALRVLVKFMKRTFWWDDFILIISWLMVVALTSLIVDSVSLGLGKHVWDVDPENISKILYRTGINATISILVSAWTKTAFAMMLLRITSGWMMYLIWAIIISMNLISLITIPLRWLRCKPNETDEGCVGWDLFMKYAIFSGAYPGVMVIILAFLPWKLIWHIRLSKKERFGVVLATSLGIIAGISTFIKCSAIPNVVKGDPTYGIPKLDLLVAVENAATIIAISILPLRPLFRHVKAQFQQKQTVTSHVKPKPATTETRASTAAGESCSTSTTFAAAQTHEGDHFGTDTKVPDHSIQDTTGAGSESTDQIV